LLTLTGDLAREVHELGPKTAKEAAEIEDRKLEAHQWLKTKSGEDKSRGTSCQLEKLPNVARPGPNFSQGHPPFRNNAIGGPRSEAAGFRREERICFRCNKKGHLKRDCTAKIQAVQQRVTPRTSVEPCRPLCEECADISFIPELRALVNGQEVTAIRDTGADMIYVREQFVRPEDYTGERLGIYLADGKELKERPLARIYLDSPFIRGRVLAVAMEALGADLYIGNSATLEGGDKVTISAYPWRELLAAVQTRAQKEREEVKDAPPKVVTVRGLD